MIQYIKDCTYTFGKAKIVLKNNSFYIESKYQDVLRELLKNPIIRNARISAATSSSTTQLGEQIHGITSNTTTSTTNITTNATVVVVNSSMNSNVNTNNVLNEDGFFVSNAPIEDRRHLDYTRLVFEIIIYLYI